MSVFLEPHVVSPAVQMLSLRTPTLPPATHTNAFVVGTRECVLIEPASPYAEEIERTAGWVEAARERGMRPLAILLTHHHRDHAGGAAALRERLELPLWAHDSTARQLADGSIVDRCLEDQERIALDGPTPSTLEAVHTPGHASGHLCFFEREGGVLIAGDMVAGVGTILIEPGDGDMVQYLASLARMRALGASVLLPAHGGPIERPHERLDFYVKHRLLREAKIIQALQTLSERQAVALDTLLPLAYGDTPTQLWPLAALSAEAHLIKLEHDGRAERQGALWRAK